MTTSTFAPFNAIKVTCEVEWDKEDDYPWEPGQNNKDRIPEKVYTVELDADSLIDNELMWVDDETGEYVIDNDALAESDILSDELTESARFCHYGYNVLALAPIED